MATINLRSANPNGLTNTQIDANFTNLNNDKVENADCVATNTSNKVVKRDASGDFAANIITALDFNASSDENLKDIVGPIENALEIVKRLEGIRYSMKADQTKKIKVGVSAQKTQQALPEVVGQDFDGNLTVAYANITAVLIEAVKELSKQVEELQKNK